MGRVVSVRPRWTGLCHFDSQVQIHETVLRYIQRRCMSSSTHCYSRVSIPGSLIRQSVSVAGLAGSIFLIGIGPNMPYFTASCTNKHRRTYEQLRYKKIDLLWDYGGFLNVVITIHSPSTCIGQAPLRHSLTRSHQIQKYG